MNIIEEMKLINEKITELYVTAQDHTLILEHQKELIDLYYRKIEILANKSDFKFILDGELKVCRQMRRGTKGNISILFETKYNICKKFLFYIEEDIQVAELLNNMAIIRKEMNVDDYLLSIFLLHKKTLSLAFSEQQRKFFVHTLKLKNFIKF